MSTDRYTFVMQKKENKSAAFAVRMRPTVKAAGERAAADENRSLSSLMETLLIEYLKDKGYLLNEPSQ